MQAIWYEQRGAARDVLTLGSMPAPQPGPGEVRLRLHASGVNPGDVKKRGHWMNAAIPYPRVIPHSDGAGWIDAVGAGVPAARIGEPAWCYGAQSYRPFGTAAEWTVVPSAQAVALPAGADSALLQQAACLGIAGITGYRALFADGPVRGLTVLVWGAASGVGAMALQMAVRGGAQVLAVVRRQEQVAPLMALGAAAVFLAGDPALTAHIRAAAPQGVQRIADVDFGGHIEINAAVLATGGSIASYYSSREQPAIPYWTLGFADATLRLLGSDDFSAEVKAAAAAELTAALAEGRLRPQIGAVLPLPEAAAAHERVEQGQAGHVLLLCD